MSEYAKHNYKTRQKIAELEHEEEIRKKEREIERKEEKAKTWSSAAKAANITKMAIGLYDKSQTNLVTNSGLLDKNVIVSDGKNNFKMNMFKPKVTKTTGKWYPGKNVADNMSAVTKKAQNRVQVNQEFLDAMNNPNLKITDKAGNVVNTDYLQTELADPLSGIGIDTENNITEVLDAMSKSDKYIKPEVATPVTTPTSKKGVKGFFEGNPKTAPLSLERMGDVWNPLKKGKSLGGKMGSTLALIKTGSELYEFADEFGESSLDEKIQQGLSAISPWLMTLGPMGMGATALVELWGRQYED